jgi:L-lactate dehydrogenase (cytochrome)
LQLLHRRAIPFGNWENLRPDVPHGPFGLGEFAVSQLSNPHRSWDDVTWIRQAWKGPLLLKGVMSAATASRAISTGVDGLIVSNHGGRQLDGLPATLRVLPEILDAVDGHAEVLLDGGVRRGSDVVKAIALGARACLLGRPWLYALAINGERGVAEMLQLVYDEIDRVLALLGCASVQELDRSFVRPEFLRWTTGT